jgi:putative Holliday junction resolvase
MKILGVDYGTKRIGVAISDEGAGFAFPKGVLANDDKLVAGLAKIIHDEGITAIVLGDPGDNKISADVKSFAKKLEETFGLEVIMEKEFMTSMHVSQAGGKKPIARQSKKDTGPKKDDSAAALILQRYLDRK